MIRPVKEIPYSKTRGRFGSHTTQQQYNSPSTKTGKSSYWACCTGYGSKGDKVINSFTPDKHGNRHLNLFRLLPRKPK